MLGQGQNYRNHQNITNSCIFSHNCTFIKEPVITDFSLSGYLLYLEMSMFKLGEK